MKLFHVQDADRPMYVVAKGWEDALSKWRRVIRAENPDLEPDEPIDPAGVALVCDEDDLIADSVVTLGES